MEIAAFTLAKSQKPKAKSQNHFEIRQTMKIFTRILIANRGEIAVRIARTCREMGIVPVAVYSDFDREAPHVRDCDQAVPLSSSFSAPGGSAGEGACAPQSQFSAGEGVPTEHRGSSARESYLNIEKIIAAARKTRVDAIHPGYGFLAENAGFAAACEAAGIVFIGPRSEVIRALGSKVEGRKLAQSAGVPVAPQPEENEFPRLIKASAGGGGRGMRVVRSAAEYKDALAAASGEAERAFGDGTLLVEKYIEGARHVEVQVLGDHHGNLMHFYERDCSVQRRYQKIIEESPSPAVTPELRRRMTEAALALARQAGYTNAGTVEFLLAPTGDFYFIEVNTRIQVEHPVTEMVTGLDLVRLQIEIAQGGTLPGERPPLTGHAIEARLYAEDPANDFLPSTGTLHVWSPPVSAGLRVESGVEEGSRIGVHYDPLLAKVIAHAPDRDSAIRKLAYALRQFGAQGVRTNREFLIQALEHPDFRAGRAHTGFQPEAPRAGDPALDQVFAGIAYAYRQWSGHRRRKILPSIRPGFRNNPYPAPPGKFEIEGRVFEVSGDALKFPTLSAKDAKRMGHPGEKMEHPAGAMTFPTLSAKGAERMGHPGEKMEHPAGAMTFPTLSAKGAERMGHPGATMGHTEILAVDENSVAALVDGVRHEFRVRRAGEEYFLRSDLGQSTVIALPRYPRPAGASRQAANSPMPGQVLRVLVAAGQRVGPGDPLVVLEAMKMEQTVRATMSGRVGAVLVKPGEIVSPGQMLVEIHSLEESDEHASSSAAKR
jgi:propionyl-CoA carboxylase alpha chain